MFSVLVLTSDPAPDQHPLMQGLRAHPDLAVSVATHLNGTEGTRRTKAPVRAVPPGTVVVALLEPDDTRENLSAEHEALLLDHLRTGGGLVVAGATLAAWADHPSLLAALGKPTRAHTPLTELIAMPTLADPLTRRLDSFAITDRADLLSELDPDAVALLTTSWYYQPRTLAYRLPVGAGTTIVMPLGQERAAWDHPALVQFALRATLAAGGRVEADRPVNMAMIGYGAIGQAHGTAISQVPGLHYALVCDRLPARLTEAQRVFPLVRTCTDMADVATDPEIDAVIISTPPNSHAAIARQFLEAGKHVILEKPFCLTRAEADDLIALAERQQRALTVYQCRRWDPDFLAIQETIASGAIGEVFHLEAFIGGFAYPCHY